MRRIAAICLALAVVPVAARAEDHGPPEDDHLYWLQRRAIEENRADWGYWGTQPDVYSGWTNHSNRLVPVYTFGITLDAVRGENSPYRDPERLGELYGIVPAGTLNPEADYFDQTDVYRLQQQAVAAGKRYIVLIVFDGMDWQTTWAAATYAEGEVAYREGRGRGLAFQDYRGVETDFGYFVAAPHNAGSDVDVDAQVVLNPGGRTPGGYDWQRGGDVPWAVPAEPDYLLGRSRDRRHAVPDSAATATAMTSGVKTYNNAVNVDWQGQSVVPIARQLQQDGFAVGVVTDVPISHATPACAYANNVHRGDYQDLTRDLVGLPSVANRSPLPGVDVLIGTGWGRTSRSDSQQGQNFVPGNRYITDDDLAAIDARHGGPYHVVQRADGVDGSRSLDEAARQAAAEGLRLFGLFGTSSDGHLPFRTASGNYHPAPGADSHRSYSPADLEENPTLAEMTVAALEVLYQRSDRFWMMIEAGDVDWANHQNNVDASIGSVLGGDEAFNALAAWIEQRDLWDETAVILTADHGHMLVLERPEALVGH